MTTAGAEASKKKSEGEAAAKKKIDDEAANMNNNNNSKKDIGNLMNTGKLSVVEYEQCVNSLLTQGSPTSYESMCKFVKTRTITQIKAYYGQHKVKLLCDIKRFASVVKGNDGPAEGATKDVNILE